MFLDGVVVGDDGGYRYMYYSCLFSLGVIIAGYTVDLSGGHVLLYSFRACPSRLTLPL